MSDLQRGQRNSQRPPAVTGAVNVVPCPHCGRPNDLRELDGQNLLDTGSKIVCCPVDGQKNTGHCGRVFVVVRIQMVKAISVVPSNESPRNATQAAQPARTVAPGLIQRLLRR